jgi:hypothetical protein
VLFCQSQNIPNLVRIHRKTLNLFQTLLVFHDSLLSLGSGFRLAKAADVLRTDLLTFLILFHHNASGKPASEGPIAVCVSLIQYMYHIL